MRDSHSGWLKPLVPARWLPGYRRARLETDAIVGVTLAAYAIPVSLAYASLASLPAQVSLYGYLLGGVGYALVFLYRLAMSPLTCC